MIHSIGSLRNLPANINLNSIPYYFKTNQFTTSVGFRCYYPTTINNYPVEKKGLLFVDKIKNLLKLYYFTKDATYISSSIYIGNTIKKLDWFQVVDARHNSIFNNVTDVKKLVTDKDVQTIVDRFLSTYDDTELWKSIEPKFHKDLWNQYANKQDPHIRRANEVYIATNRGVVVRGGNIHTSRRGITVRRPETGARFSVYSDGAHYIVGNLVQGNTHFYSDRKLLLQSRNRPIVQSGDAGNGNREIVIRADLRWKQMYNGRQGLRSIAYPGHAREVIVQLYTDVGGRTHRTRYPYPNLELGATIYGKTDRYLYDRIYDPARYGLGGEVVNGIIGRDRGYKEYAPMHFIKGVYNRINQDTAFIEHHGNCTITLNSIGYDNIVNGRSTSGAVHDFNPLDQDMAILDERYGFATNRTRNNPRIRMRISHGGGGSKKPSGESDRDVTIAGYHVYQEYGGRQLYWPMHLISESVWRSSRNLAHPVNEIPCIRRVWWR